MSFEKSARTQLIENEIIMAMGLSPDGFIGLRLRPIFRRATRRFSEIFAKGDQIVGEQGLSAAARFLLSHVVDGFEVRGTEHIPREGPLVIASNHPGTVDSIVLMATIPRDDLKMIAGAIPFLQSLPNASKHLIFTSYVDPHNKMVVLRKSIQHLREGGALLLFPGTGIDPDPSFMPHAEEELKKWSHSLEFFLRTVSQTQVVTGIVSNVIDPRYMRHPITWLRKARPDRQRLAMIMQIVQQMLGKKLDLVPRVTYGEALNLRSIGTPENTVNAITDSARQLMKMHMGKTAFPAQVPFAN
jgi:hypothetical protein